MSNANAEREGYSGFERFLFFLTPILFTAVLLGVLLFLFNSELRDSALKVGNKIPVLGSILPEPSQPAQTEVSEEELTASSAMKKIEELNAQLVSEQAELQQEKDKTAQSEQTIASLKSQIESLNKQAEENTISAGEYDSKISSLAEMYGKMVPGKAAPILESMTLEEASLILGAMSDTQRVRILEKMTPKVAAEVTSRIKDADSAENEQIAALQARIKELESANSDTSILDTAELKNTFAAMAPASAAEILYEMAKTNQAKALRILGALTDSSRSQVLAAMANLDDDNAKKKTADLVSKLMPANP
ncbi:MotE family protein [Cohnella fermenti]|uniref:MgtE protein n=1 Tax=Cohnella fermenti TaxID=2565925 RepID=A0A4S4C2B2_9BACL|nr:MgtE protein [Cohnella fermenti]THF81264.1 MgtE protein [Cohnella fermenti]